MLMPSVFSDNFVEDMFDDFFFPATSYKQRNRSVAMNADVKEKKDSYEIALDLPGYDKNEVKVELSEGYLTISAKHSEDKEEKSKDERYIRKERYVGQMQRSFYVGDEITDEDIKASFTNGVLNLTVPKKEAKASVPEKKYIAIEG